MLDSLHYVNLAVPPGSTRPCWLVNVEPDWLHFQLLPVQADGNAKAWLADNITVIQQALQKYMQSLAKCPSATIDKQVGSRKHHYAEQVKVRIAAWTTGLGMFYFC